MKKVLTILAVAAALMSVSCIRESEVPSAGKTNVTFTVDAGQIATRAISGTHGTATRLMVGVYLKGSGDAYSYISAISQNNVVTTWPTVVSLDLAKNETYKIVFWADEGADAYTIDWTNGTVVETATTIAGNALNRDAYYKLVEITTGAGATGESITLTRPVAQVNVGTSDLAAYKAAAAYDGNIETQVVVSGVAPGLNLLTGAATSGEPVDLTFSYTDNMDATLVSGGNNYNYLALNYILCPADNTLTAGISIRKDDAAEAINAFEVSNMPVKANYRTNVVGKLLTGIVEYTVDVDTDFVNDLGKLVAPSFENIAALNAYLAGLTSGPGNGDNGDIKPEVAIVRAIGDVKTITLPNDTLHLSLQILAHYTGEDGLTIAYPTAEGAKHTKVLYVTIPELSKLTANLPDTHLEIVSGSSIDLSDVHTSASTFVVQKNARVGVLNIKQGNAKIAGSIDSLKVNPAATSDGAAAAENNAVQVFLEKDSAVEKIILNAKTDVVVEQPKDQIEVEETEKKVAVYVNDGAANSTATAQNGGVIYVEANVPCTVTADGTSTAEEGNVSSTVIIKETATGSAVVATNGASVDLKANGDCTASAEGTAEGQGSTPATPSTITITEAEADVVVNTSTNDNGVIYNTSGKAVVVTYAAKIGDTTYETLQEAFAAVPDDVETTIVLQNRYVIIGNDGIAIGSKKNIILDLNGWLLSNAVNENRASQIFAINGGGTLTVRDSKGNGEIFNDVQKGTQPGEWWSTPQYNYATNVIKNSGTFILESGTVRQTASGSICYAVDNNSTSYDTETILKGGVMTSNGTTMRMFCNSTNNKNQLTIPENSTALLEGNYTALWIQLPGSNASSMKKASLDIKGGTLKGNTYAFYDYSYGDGWDNVEYNITGGKFIGGIWTYKGYNTENPYKFLTGGYYSEDPSDYVADGYVSYFDDAAQVWKIKLEDVAQVGDVMYTSLVDAFEAAQAGDEVKMVKNMYIEATVPAPYGNKCGIKQDGEILNGQNYNLYLTTGGDQYTIMTSGGTIKNLTIASGFRAILLMYPQTDVYIDNVTSGPNVCYAINTAEQGNPDARIIATNSTFLGWCSFSLIASASFTNCKFGQGTYYTNTWGRLIKPYVTTTFTDCEFGYNCAEGDKYYLDLSAFQAGQTIKMINCKVGDTVITADNVADLLDGWDESNNNYSFDKSIFEIIQFE